MRRKFLLFGREKEKNIRPKLGIAFFKSPPPVFVTVLNIKQKKLCLLRNNNNITQEKVGNRYFLSYNILRQSNYLFYHRFSLRMIGLCAQEERKSFTISNFATQKKGAGKGSEATFLTISYDFDRITTQFCLLDLFKIFVLPLYL